LDIAAKVIPASLKAAGTILGGFGVFKGMQIRPVFRLQNSLKI